MAQCPIGAPLKAGRGFIFVYGESIQIRTFVWRTHTKTAEWLKSNRYWQYGWWPNLVDSWVGGVHWIFRRFWIFYGSFGGPQLSHWIRSTFGIQNPWFSARFVEYGSSSDRFLWFSTFSEMLAWLPGPLFILFSAQPSQRRHLEFFSRDQKDVRRRVTQIRGDITSGNALFDLFVSI